MINIKQKKYLLLIVLLLFLNIRVHSQDKEINNWYTFNETKSFESAYIPPIYPLNDENILEKYTIPTFAGEKYNIQYIVTDWVQFHYNKYKENKLTKVQFLDAFPNIDTTQLIQKNLKNYVVVLVFSNTSKKSFILDRNYNGNFSDDVVYSFNRTDVKDVLREDAYK